jgi:hypothetical protein
VETIASQAKRGAHEREEIDAANSNHTINRTARARQTQGGETEDRCSRCGITVQEDSSGEEVAIEIVICRDNITSRISWCRNFTAWPKTTSDGEPSSRC